MFDVICTDIDLETRSKQTSILKDSVTNLSKTEDGSNMVDERRKVLSILAERLVVGKEKS